MLRRRNKKHYRKYKEEARTLVHARIAYFNSFYNFPLGRIAIKNSRSRWGSCSIKGNLNFNYKLLFLPLPLVDYIVVHELCHLEHFNHSPRFWARVGERVPDHTLRRRALRALEKTKSLGLFLPHGKSKK